MTNDQIRLHFGELNASEMRLARAIVGWHEAREARLRAAADGLAGALEKARFVHRAITTYSVSQTLEEKAVNEQHCEDMSAALAAYQATKQP